MLFPLLADLTVILHLAFVFFVVGGGLLIPCWPRLAWVHLPAVLWAGFIEFSGWLCPLTPLEYWLRRQGGAQPYPGGFVEHYLLPVLYPINLSRELQIYLGLLVLGLNAVIYGWAWRRRP
jgi:hypothetical protein